MSEKQAKSQSKDQKKRKIFIGGIAKTVTEPMLYKYFSNFGEVERAVVNREHYTDKSRGSGFILFRSKDSAQRVLGFAQPHVLEGKQFDCQPCLLREEIKKGKSSLAPNKKNETSSTKCSINSTNQYTLQSGQPAVHEDRENWTYSRYPSLRTGSDRRMLYKYDYYPSHEEIPYLYPRGQDYFGSRPCHNRPQHHVIKSEESYSNSSLDYIRDLPCNRKSRRTHQQMYHQPTMSYQKTKKPLAKTSLILKVGKCRPNSSYYHNNYVLNLGKEAKLPEGYHYSGSDLSRSSFDVKGERRTPLLKGKNEDFGEEFSFKRSQQSHIDQSMETMRLSFPDFLMPKEGYNRNTSGEWDFGRVHGHRNRYKRRKKTSCVL